MSKLSLDVYVYGRDDSNPALSKLVQVKDLDGKELEHLVDQDIRKFSEFYEKTLKNGPLSPFEAAAIKTYMYWKTHPEE